MSEEAKAELLKMEQSILGELALAERIISISKKLKLSHLGSALTALPIVMEIYSQKKGDEKFVMDNGHAHICHLVVKEALGLCDAEKEIQHDIHCNFESGCDVATGSLGIGSTIALGLAMASPTKRVWLLTSDGGMEEGSCWEALKIKADLKLDNLKWYVNANGYTALKEIDVDMLEKRIHAFCPDVKVVRTSFSGYPFLEGIDAHYVTL